MDPQRLGSDTYPVQHSPGAGTMVFLKNLAPSLDTKDVQHTFAAFGSILSCKVAINESTGANRGYGFVKFETEEAAQNAIRKMNGALLKDRKVYVGRPSGFGEDARQFNNVYIKNFGTEILDSELLLMCYKYGKILSLKVMREENGTSKGFGFVSFESAEAAQACADALNNSEFEGRTLYAGRAQKSSERTAELRARFETIRHEQSISSQGTNLYVKNLGPDVDDTKLRKEFGNFGSISSAKVMRNDKGRSRGFGFVCFSSREEAERAREFMHNRRCQITDKSKMLYVSLAERKEERRARLAKEHEIKSGTAPARDQQSQLNTLHIKNPKPGVDNTTQSEEFEKVGRTSTKARSQPQLNNLYIKNLKPGVDDTTLSEEFGKFGKIISAKVMRKDDGSSKGFGFVCFSTEDEAAAAIIGMRDTSRISVKPLYVSYAEKKEDRKAMLTEQRRRQNMPAKQAAIGGSVVSVLVQEDIREPFAGEEPEHYYNECKKHGKRGEEKFVLFLKKNYTHSEGKARTVLKLHLEDDFALADCIKAAIQTDGSYKRTKAFLSRECKICYSLFPVTEMAPMPTCDCEICDECFEANYATVLDDAFSISKCSCPGCDKPDIANGGDEVDLFFGYLQQKLQAYLDEDDQLLFETKLIEWTLSKDPNFRWCSKCGSGAVNENRNKKMVCPSCSAAICFHCNKEWNDQHVGLSCEEFARWQNKNDPNLQEKGLSDHLAKFGIECPKCHFRYELAKGGCMHFTCGQCKHEFCSGCKEEMVRDPCKLFPSCTTTGMHAHHPRDCLYYLRDYEVIVLEQLLQDHNKEYRNSSSRTACNVKEQQNFGRGLRDVICGKEVHGKTGQCRKHYIEYLVELINCHCIDPVEILKEATLKEQLRRNGLPYELPRSQLIKVVQLRLPLQRIPTKGANHLEPEEAPVSGNPAEGQKSLWKFLRDLAGRL